MAYYVGILDGSGDAWGIRIPDLQGCHGGGNSPDAALADAISAARDYAAHLAAKGRELPQPRSLQDILGDPDARPDLGQGESSVLIPLVLDMGRSVDLARRGDDARRDSEG